MINFSVEASFYIGILCSNESLLQENNAPLWCIIVIFIENIHYLLLSLRKHTYANGFFVSLWDRETATEPLSFSVGVGFKVPLGDDIVPINATVNVNINADDIPIGFGHTYYYEEPVQTMTLENFGFEVTIGNTN